MFAIQLLGTLLLFALGAVTGLLGMLGLLLTTALWVRMAVYFHHALQAGQEVEAALQATLGTDYQQSIEPDLLQQIPTKLDYKQLLKPFSIQLPEVQCTKNVVLHTENSAELALDIYCKNSRPAVNMLCSACCGSLTTFTVFICNK